MSFFPNQKMATLSIINISYQAPNNFRSRSSAISAIVCLPLLYQHKHLLICWWCHWPRPVEPTNNGQRLYQRYGLPPVCVFHIWLLSKSSFPKSGKLIIFDKILSFSSFVDQEPLCSNLVDLVQCMVVSKRVYSQSAFLVWWKMTNVNPTL